MTDDTPNTTPSSDSSGCPLPNPACSECGKSTWTVPIYLDSPVSISQIRIADLHPICSKCQTSKFYKGRHRFSRPLKDETVRALVEKYDVDDYKGVLWECAMLLSGFREPVEDEENGKVTLRSNVARRKSDDKGRRNPRKSTGIDRQVREAKEELGRKRKAENLQKMETKEIRLTKDGGGGNSNDESQKENHVMRHFENHDDGNFWDRISFEDGDKPDWAADVASE